MSLKLTNNATASLAVGITTSSTSISVSSSSAALFPTLSPGDWFPITVLNSSGAFEIMHCTARTGTALTVTRAQEGTTAKAFGAGSRVELRITAAAISELVETAGSALAKASNLSDVYSKSATRSNLGVYSKDDVDGIAESIIGEAPEDLDTLEKLAASIGGDASYAETVTEALAGKAGTAAATTSANGLMSSADKAKLNAVGSMANRALTISSSAPSGGIDGDVWYQVQ